MAAGKTPTQRLRQTTETEGGDRDGGTIPGNGDERRGRIGGAQNGAEDGGDEKSVEGSGVDREDSTKFRGIYWSVGRFGREAVWTSRGRNHLGGLTKKRAEDGLSLFFYIG